MYGCGLRSLEVIRLRVHDVDFEQNKIIVREAKGNKDRATFLPKGLVPALRQQIEKVRSIHSSDLEHGLGDVWLPDAQSVKYSNAEKGIGWQWFSRPALSPPTREAMFADGITSTSRCSARR